MAGSFCLSLDLLRERVMDGGRRTSALNRHLHFDDHVIEWTITRKLNSHLAIGTHDLIPIGLDPVSNPAKGDEDQVWIPRLHRSCHPRNGRQFMHPQLIGV